MDYSRVEIKFGYGLCSVQILNAILQPVFSAAAQLPPSAGYTWDVQ